MSKPSDNMFWFPFFVKDWLSDPDVSMMTSAQRGGYLQLLCKQWLFDDCTLPDNDRMLMQLSGMTKAEWRSELMRSKFPSCLSSDDLPDIEGRCANVKQYKSWVTQIEKLRTQSLNGKKGAAKRWGKKDSQSNGVAILSPLGSPSIGQWRNGSHIELDIDIDIDKDKDKETPPAGAKDSSNVAVLLFQTISGDDWGLESDLVEVYARAYTRIDIIEESRKAQVWIESNPSKRKTIRGMKKFLNGWMARANEAIPKPHSERAEDLPIACGWVDDNGDLV